MSIILNENEIDTCIETHAGDISSPVLANWLRKRFRRYFLQSCLMDISFDHAIAVFKNYIEAVNEIRGKNHFIDMDTPSMDRRSYDRYFRIDGVGSQIIRLWIICVHHVTISHTEVLDSISRILNSVSSTCEYEIDLDELISSNISTVRSWWENEQRKIAERDRLIMVCYYYHSFLMRNDGFLSPKIELEWIRNKYDGREVASVFSYNPKFDTYHIADWLKSIHLYSSMQTGTTIDHIIELAKKTIRNIDKISLPDSEIHARKWFDLVNSIADNVEEDVDGLVEILKVENGVWFQLTSNLCLIREGKLMDHCVGSGSYDVSGSNGTSKIFSLRDENNMPLITIETNKKGAVRQIKGPKNTTPDAKFREDIIAFLNNSCVALPIICNDIKALDIGHIQDRDGFNTLFVSNPEKRSAGGQLRV